jgi:hypothetical protein
MLFKVYTRGHVGRHASLSRVKNDEAVPDGWLGYTRTHSSKGIKSLIVFLFLCCCCPDNHVTSLNQLQSCFFPLPFSFISFG